MAFNEKNAHFFNKCLKSKRFEVLKDFLIELKH